MKISYKKLFFSLFIFITLIYQITDQEFIYADEGEIVINGVITEIINNNEGELESFQIVDNKGNLINLNVSYDETITEYGLENITGERWISNQKESPVKASKILKDHQERFIPITVTASGNIALKIVEKEKRNLETNLTYLSVVFGVAWLSFFVYIYIVDRRQKILESKIKKLNE